MVDLSPRELQRLYLEEHLSEKAIADRFGTYQVHVGRLRRRYGIPTLTKSDRFVIPDRLTETQEAILLGSMLGDGRLFSSGSQTSGYSEYHCQPQGEYLDWKASVWGPFFCSTRPALKTVRGVEYRGNILRLVGCKLFRPYWEMFYPCGRGSKTFVRLLFDRITGLSVAVWLMDDGSRTSGGYLRFSVSPRPEDQEVLLAILRKFDIVGKVYHSKGDHELVVGNKLNLSRLSDLVLPHIHPSMTYKVRDLRS